MTVNPIGGPFDPLLLTSLSALCKALWYKGAGGWVRGRWVGIIRRVEHMASVALGCRKALVGTVGAIFSSFCTKGLLKCLHLFCERLLLCR